MKKLFIISITLSTLAAIAMDESIIEHAKQDYKRVVIQRNYQGLPWLGWYHGSNLGIATTTGIAARALIKGRGISLKWVTVGTVSAISHFVCKHQRLKLYKNK